MKSLSKMHKLTLFPKKFTIELVIKYDVNIYNNNNNNNNNSQLNYLRYTKDLFQELKGISKEVIVEIPEVDTSVFKNEIL